MRRALKSSLGRRYGLTPSTYTEGMPIVRSFQHILRRDIAALWDFRLTNWTGDQKLWTDSGRTSVLESVGDPVGSGDELVDGLHATQSTDGDRPTYLGLARGVSTSGGSFFGVDGSKSAFSYIHQNQPSAVRVVCTPDSGQPSSFAVLLRNELGLDDTGFLLAWRPDVDGNGNGRFDGFYRYGDGSNQTRIESTPHPPDQEYDVWLVEDDSRGIELYVNGTVDATATKEDIATGDATYDLGIFGETSGDSSRFFEGDTKLVELHDKRVTP